MKRFFTALLVLGLLFPSVANAAEVRQPSGEEAIVASDAVNEVVQDITTLSQLKLELVQAQYRYFLFQSNSAVAEEELELLQTTLDDLEWDVEYLEAKINDSDKQILSVKSQKEENVMTLQDLEDELEDVELQFEEQKELVGDLLLLLYLKRDVYFTDGELDLVSLLASDQTVSESLQEVTFLNLMEEENRVQMQTLADLSVEMEDAQEALFTKQEQLNVLDVQLAEEKVSMEEEIASKAALLEETREQTEFLEEMLSASGEREEDLISEIDSYQQSIEELRPLVKEKRDALSKEELELVQKIEADLLEELDMDEVMNFVDFIWPVSPRPGLTAHFHDDNYMAVFGVPHRAIDIRAKQETEIHAAADAIVEQVVFKEGSAEYAKIVLRHPNMISTVYGHVSGVNVSIGDFVEQGDVIGWTGGAPGSVGAGGRTTGPHLHLEMWLDGVPIDPLTQLPLEEVPVESLPDDYEQHVQEHFEEEIMKIEEALGL